MGGISDRLKAAGVRVRKLDWEPNTFHDDGDYSALQAWIPTPDGAMRITSNEATPNDAQATFERHTLATLEAIPAQKGA
jgi:hypothetical protein